jgi:bisphosphoglycerate-independent phosphoglycerate mutase
VGRRFQRFGAVPLSAGGSFELIDDYGHHPVEMGATIAAARGAFPGRRLVLAFQPHRYTRTRDCFEDFARVLSSVDALLLTEVYAAGESPIVAADGRALARAVRVLGKVEPVFVEQVAELPDAICSAVRDGDVVFFFNFRADRGRQLSVAFLDKAFAGFEREVVPSVHYVTLTEYDRTYGVPVIFEPQSLSNILGETVSQAGLKQLRIAETEKYPHVTYFFNGGVEQQFEGEDREIVPSPKDVATYDLKPQMSAEEVTAKVTALMSGYDLVILNFANPDMVGHTGVLEAGIKAVETIDAAVKAVVETALALGGRLLITADHGNCEQMLNPDGSPHTAHTTNLVHLVYVGADSDSVACENGILADVAPTILHLLGVKQPAEMTGRSLVHKK